MLLFGGVPGTCDSRGWRVGQDLGTVRVEEGTEKLRLCLTWWVGAAGFVNAWDGVGQELCWSHMSNVGV